MKPAITPTNPNAAIGRGCEEAHRHLRELDEKLAYYDLAAAAGKASWGHVGDLGRINQVLRELLGHEG